MIASRVAQKGIVWQAECPACGWWVTAIARDRGMADMDRTGFQRLVKSETCMCEPHRFFLGQRFDDGTRVSAIDMTKLPVRISLDVGKPEYGDHFTMGGGKRFTVIRVHRDGSVSFREESPLNGPRAR